MSSYSYAKQMALEMKIPSKDITLIIRNNKGSKLIWKIDLPDNVELSSEDVGKAVGEYITKKYKDTKIEVTLLSSALPDAL